MITKFFEQRNIITLIIPHEGNQISNFIKNDSLKMS